ncbi:MAG: MBL fold metallo-hydrolase [Clostridia bacterium]|nr:MBL fold metallo-hydrolase [Clostridia bacterium]
MKGYMWPIQGHSAAKRLTWGSRQNHLSWAYMKMLREQSNWYEPHPINPYIEVYHFEDNLYGLFNQNCDGAGDVWEYLVVGPEKALLVDTAFGIGNVKGLVDELTGGKELIVVNTHIGPDHAYGNTRFDRVYCHELEAHKMRKRIQPNRYDYLFNEDGSFKWLAFDPKDIPEWREYELISCPNHTVFNLGGDYEVEMIWVPGHAEGHVMYLDKKRRRLFAGDVVCSDVINIGSGSRQAGMSNEAKYCTIEAVAGELRKLTERKEEFDYIFPGHFMVYLENHVLDKILAACDEILANPDGYDYQETRTMKDGTQRTTCYKYVRNFGAAISYNRDHGVYMPKENGGEAE